MESPFGHHHHHHRRDDDEEEERSSEYYPPPETAPPPPRRPVFDDQPPPPYSRDNEFEPPPPRPRPISHYHQEPGCDEPPPPPPPRPYYPETQVIHVSHEECEETETHHHSFRPHLPSFLHHHDQSGSPDYLAEKPSFKVYCKAEPKFHLTVRDGKVVLAPADPSDVFQKWYKDEKYSTRVKDQDGFPSFSLVNKATGQAIKHGVGETQPVELVAYNPNELNESVLWTQSKDMGDGYRTIRMVNNTHLNMDAFHGDEKSGGVHDGTVIVLWHWNKGNNQLWKIIPQADM